MLGSARVTCGELATNKPTVSDFLLDNRVSTVRIGHFAGDGQPQKYKRTERTLVAVRVVDLREQASENGMLAIGSAPSSSVFLKVKKGDPQLPAATFPYPPAPELAISYWSYDASNKTQ